jgi:GGDEF domain-containing protein
MAARDTHSSHGLPPTPTSYLSAEALLARLEEEINRAGRGATALSCVLVSLDDLQEIERTHGPRLSRQAHEYVGLALCRELRRFDRVGVAGERELIVVLPGADGARAEIVARRALARLQVIKIEAAGRRRPLRVAMTVTSWRTGLDAAELVALARTASGRRSGRDSALAFGARHP